VPADRTAGTLRVVATFESGPLAGPLRAERELEVKP
jgi:hypothetical protein